MTCRQMFTNAPRNTGVRGLITCLDRQLDSDFRLPRQTSILNQRLFRLLLFREAHRRCFRYIVVETLTQSGGIVREDVHRAGSSRYRDIGESCVNEIRIHLRINIDEDPLRRQSLRACEVTA
jgi:hypothetical protein